MSYLSHSNKGQLTLESFHLISSHANTSILLVRFSSSLFISSSSSSSHASLTIRLKRALITWDEAMLITPNKCIRLLLSPVKLLVYAILTLNTYICMYMHFIASIANTIYSLHNVTLTWNVICTLQLSPPSFDLSRSYCQQVNRFINDYLLILFFFFFFFFFSRLYSPPVNKKYIQPITRPNHKCKHALSFALFSCLWFSSLVEQAIHYCILLFILPVGCSFFSTLRSWCVPVMPVFILSRLIVLTFSFFLSLALHVHVTSGAQFEWLHWAWRASLESISLMQTASPQFSFLSLNVSLSLLSLSTRIVYFTLNSHMKNHKNAWES